MTTLRLITDIRAPAERCFDLSRHVGFHAASLHDSGERAVAGKTDGLLGPGDEVTWEATRLGARRRLSVRITAFDRARLFADEMTAGDFKRMRHEHRFEEIEPGLTRMTDVFEFESPLGPVGRVVDAVFLRHYMQRLLVGRNTRLKSALEGDEWRRFL